MRKKIVKRFKINRRGCTRLVIESKNVVIKIPNFTYSWEHFIKGILGNINEVKTWRIANIKDSHTYDYRHLICPIVWSSWGSWVLIMKRVKTLSFDEWDKIEDVDISMHKKYFEGDDTMSNYGFLDGKIVKIDYGS